MSKFTFSNYVIADTSTIAEAMQAITLNHRGTVIVVDEVERVIGVVSDGDIRRAMVKGLIVEAPVLKCLNANFIALTKKATAKEREAIFDQQPQINLVPVIDKQNRLLDLVIRQDQQASTHEK